jgi:hypothetical protein
MQQLQAASARAVTRSLSASSTADRSNIHAAALSDASPQHARAFPSHARPLLRGIPSREAALIAQRDNLERFVRDNPADFAAMPYHPWTKPVRKFGVSTSIAASSLPGCVGLRGVLLQESITTGEKESKPLLYYPGLLMTERMHSRFSQEYYCPTSLGLPALAYVDPVSHLPQPMLIVGDPTSHGAIINDGVRSGMEGSSSVRTASLHVHQCLLAIAHA